MNSSFDKTSIIGSIWGAAAVMCIAIAVYGTANNQGVESWVLAFPALMASLLTSAIWISTVMLESRGGIQKTKRQPSDSLSLLKELLDEDELEDLKHTLKQRLLDQSDGELPYEEETLKDLMRKSR